MPTAICGTCGKTRQWRAQRGARLVDLRCECGEPMGRAVWTEAGWVPAPTASKAKGRKMACCALCGRRRSVPGGGVWLTQDTVFQIHYRGEPYGQTDAGNVPAGAVVCWSHSPDYPVLLVCKAIDPDVSKPKEECMAMTPDMFFDSYDRRVLTNDGNPGTDGQGGRGATTETMKCRVAAAV